MLNDAVEPASAGRSSVLRTFGEFLRLAAVAAAIALPIRYFVAQPFIVRGASMVPNFEDREYLVIDEFSFFFREPKRGEVVVFRYPLSCQPVSGWRAAAVRLIGPVNCPEYFIKRIVALPGESVEAREDGVYITNEDHPDGFRLDEPYLPPDTSHRPASPIALGPSEYAVFGDNRAASSDSRNWGALDRGFITGRAIFRAWPPSRFGVLGNP